MMSLIHVGLDQHAIESSITAELQFEAGNS